jgi:uncharacterized tellurite resistance protein B-like protein
MLMQVLRTDGDKEMLEMEALSLIILELYTLIICAVD